MRTNSPTTTIQPLHFPRPRPARPNYVATNKLMLMLLAEGHDLKRISRSAGWPARSIHVFAGRHGYLIAADGTPYRPPVFGEQARSSRHSVWSQS